jgi:hypothetical protein
MSKEKIIISMFNDLLKFRKEDNFKKELGKFNVNIEKLKEYEVLGNDDVINELASLLKRLITMTASVEENIAEINHIIDIFNTLQKMGHYNFLFTSVTLDLGNEKINFAEYVQRNYIKVGENRKLINNAIDDSEDLIFIVSKRKAPTYVNKENKKIYN